MKTMVATPSNEIDRLDSLMKLDILDSEPEPEFDELVRLATAICDMPIGLVSLLDEDRQWFKAIVGLGVTETSRSVAFCAHAILQEEMLIVEDAELDTRFAQNPLVTGQPNLRFYAGMPIHSPEGFPVGTLCVLDQKPRKLSGAQIDALRVLASQVNSKMELRLKRRQLQAALLESERAHAELSVAKADLQVANERLLELSVTDALTGLGNRRAFDERLAIEMTTTNRGNHLSLLMMDIDHFKRLNDLHGHQAGDDALQKLGAILRHQIRGTDLAARYGGEEFVVLLRDTTELQTRALANRLMAAVRKAEWAHEPMTISIGIAERVKGEPEGKVLLWRADAALYRAKTEGRDRVVMFSEMN